MAQIPSLRKLQYLVKLHELGHFGKAAEACFVSQSTLSAGISDLESRLDRLLVERDRHNMTFTPVGLELVNQAKKILLATHQFVETAEKSGQLFESTLRLGIIPTIAPYVLPAYLTNLSGAFPDLSVLVREDLTDNLLTRLRDGELDLLIIALPYPAESIEYRSLYTDPLRLIHHPNSRFIDNAVAASLDNLPNDSVLLLEDGHCLRKHTMSTCQLFSAAQINSFSTNSLASIVQMVRYDMGVSFIPSMAINNGVLDGTGITVHEGLRGEGGHREIGLVWRETSPFRDEFTTLGNHLLEICEN